MALVATYTFAGGEVSEKLYGRVDLQKYQTGVALARNVLVGVEGGLYKRAGQYYIGKPKHQDRFSKFVPWRIADDDSYVLEFGHLYIRFIRLGGYVLYPGGHVPAPGSDAIDVGGFLEVPTDYDESDIQALKFTFANDIVYIAHRDYPPRQLKRLGLYDWDLVTPGFNPHETAPTGFTAVWQRYTGSPKTWNNVTTDDPIQDYQEIKKDLKYKIDAVMDDTGLPTQVSSQVVVEGDTGNPRLSILLTWDAKAGAREYRIFKGDNGLFGWIGTVQASEDEEFRDTNYAPSYEIVPSKPFEGFDPLTDTTQNPGVLEFYKQRMVYAGTNLDPQKLWISRPLFFNALSTSQPSQPDDAIIAKLVGNERHSIQHMVSLKKFVIFTDSAEWILGTANDAALASDTIDPTIETNYGSVSYLAPLPIGDRILFIQNISQAMLDMGYDFATNAYKADDLSRLARHLFENKTIAAWDHAAHPTASVWTVLSSGEVAVMTYVREHEIWGWARAETYGDYLDVACVPEFNQHATYFKVLRNIAGTPTVVTERVEIVYSKRVEDGFYVDCGLTYNAELPYTVGTRMDSNTFRFTRASHGLAVSDEVLIENNSFQERFIVSEVAGNVVTANLKYSDKEIPEDGDFVEGFFYECVDTIGGFTHLANENDLVALADGNVVRDISVDPDGEIHLPFKAARVHCGYPYEGEIVTLNLDPDSLSGRYHLKAVDAIRLHVLNSRGILAGPSESEHPPTPLKPRVDEDLDKPNRLLNGLYEIESSSEWSQTLGVRILLPEPLPAEILNIVPDMVYEG